MKDRTVSVWALGFLQKYVQHQCALQAEAILGVPHPSRPSLAMTLRRMRAI
jgi:hypothetical protein